MNNEIIFYKFFSYIAIIVIELIIIFVGAYLYLIVAYN